MRPTIRALFGALARQRERERDSAVIEVARVQAEGAFAILDGALTESEYIAGPRFTVAMYRSES